MNLNFRDRDLAYKTFTYSKNFFIERVIYFSVKTAVAQTVTINQSFNQKSNTETACFEFTATQLKFTFISVWSLKSRLSFIAF